MKKLVFTSLLFLWMISASPLFAQSPSPDPNACDPGMGGLVLGNCLRLSNNTLVSEKYSSLGFIVNLAVRNLFVAAGFILFLLVIYAGYQFITGGKKGAEAARDMMGKAIAGFLLMFSAYWIVQLVQYLTGANIPI